MKIWRDNLEIELTEDELDKAYRERNAYFNRKDLICKIKEYCDEYDCEDHPIPSDEDEIEIGKQKITVGELRKKIYDKKWMDNLESSFQHALENNESFWESFWLTAEDVIEGAIEKDKQHENL